MDAKHGDLVHNWSIILDLSSVTIKPSLLWMYPSHVASLGCSVDSLLKTYPSLQCSVNSLLKMYPYNNKDCPRDCFIRRSHQLARNTEILIWNKHIHHTDSKQLCFDNQYNDSKRLWFDVDPGNEFRECYGFLTMHPFCEYNLTPYHAADFDPSINKDSIELSTQGLYTIFDSNGTFKNFSNWKLNCKCYFLYGFSNEVDKSNGFVWCDLYTTVNSLLSSKLIIAKMFFPSNPSTSTATIPRFIKLGSTNLHTDTTGFTKMFCVLRKRNRQLQGNIH